MKKMMSAISLLLLAQAAIAGEYNPTPSKKGLSLVFLESELNEVMKEMTSKSVFGLTKEPSKFNWNEMIEKAIAFRASNGGCSADCYAMSTLKIPTSPDVYVPLFIKIKSVVFDFRADGKIFIDAGIGINIINEVASFAVRLEGSGQLAQYSPLELATHAVTGKPKSTADFQTATLKFCPDQIATQAKLTAFNLSYSNSVLKEIVKNQIQAELDRIIADKGANCHVLTEKLSPPAAIYGRGMRLAFPSIHVSQDLLEVRTSLINYGNVASIVGIMLQ